MKRLMFAQFLLFSTTLLGFKFTCGIQYAAKLRRPSDIVRLSQTLHGIPGRDVSLCLQFGLQGSAGHSPKTIRLATSALNISIIGSWRSVIRIFLELALWSLRGGSWVGISVAYK